jgi:hypothetical protein
MKTMAKNKITNDSYGLVESADLVGSPIATYSVKIKDKKYKNVIVSYGKIGLNVQEDGQSAKLSFKYQIDDPADFDRQELESDHNFNTYLGDLLAHIIQTAFDSGNYKVGDAPTKASDEVIDVNSTTDDSSTEISQR